MVQDWSKLAQSQQFLKYNIMIITNHLEVWSIYLTYKVVSFYQIETMLNYNWVRDLKSIV